MKNRESNRLLAHMISRFFMGLLFWNPRLQRSAGQQAAGKKKKKASKQEAGRTGRLMHFMIVLSFYDSVRSLSNPCIQYSNVVTWYFSDPSLVLLWFNFNHAGKIEWVVAHWMRMCRTASCAMNSVPWCHNFFIAATETCSSVWWVHAIVIFRQSLWFALKPLYYQCGLFS